MNNKLKPSMPFVSALLIALIFSFHCHAQSEVAKTGYLQESVPTDGTSEKTISNTGEQTYDFNLTQASAVRIEFDAKMNSGNPVIQIAIDGTRLGLITLSQTAFNTFQSAPINLNAGDYTISLKGTTSGSAAAVKNISYQRIRKWSSNTTWQDNSKPTGGASVSIPSGAYVVIDDQNIAVKEISVKGHLLQSVNMNASITTEHIDIRDATGLFQAGKKGGPLTGDLSITLTGANTGQNSGVGSKFLAAGMSATLELHGEERISWSQLGAKAAKGANQITMKEPVDWKVNDQILITSSRIDWNEAEQRKVTAISGDKRTLTLDKALNFPHIGKSYSYTRPLDGKTWVGDIRAEVGRLTKNITIQGDASSANSKYGGHVMIHMMGKAYVDGVEFYQMGQTGVLGRYPFHWHLIQEKGAGQYLTNCSIYKSFSRAITIHGTESTLVENNFCYDHIGHGIFLEDGSERFNTIRNNVVLLSKRPAAGDELTPSDNQFNEVQNRSPSSFWITNPNNIIEDNVAAGTHGTGFWFAMPTKPMGPSANLPRFQGIEPHKEKLGSFKRNKAHSCKSGFDIFDRLDANHKIVKNQGWQRTDNRYMDDCVWYANDLAVYGGIGNGRTYTEDVIFRGNIWLDNKTAIMHANYSTTDNACFVANTGEDVFNGERKLNRGYDGACTIKNSYLVGWNASNANYVQNTGGAQKHVNYRVSGFTMDHPGPPRMNFPDYSKTPKGTVGANSYSHPRYWSYVHWDRDGSLGGKPNTSIITNHPLCRDGTEQRYANWTNLYRTDRRFAFLSVVYPANVKPHVTIVRTKPGTPKAGQYYINGHYTLTQIPAIVNDDFLYTLQYETLHPSKNFTLRMGDSYVTGDEILVRIKDFGKLPGITVTGNNLTKHNTLAALKSSNSNGWGVFNDYLYIKMVTRANVPDQSFNIKWNSQISWAVLDTDGDGISDLQESINGTDPIPNDPIPNNPLLTISNTPPTVALDLSNGNTVLEGIPWVLTANVTANGNTISRLVLYVDGDSIRQESSPPYEWGHSSSPLQEELSGLSPGDHVLKIVLYTSTNERVETEATITVTEAKGPYNGLIAIPGTLEGEEYDKGGEGVSFHDTDLENRGGQFRTDAVDIGATSNGYTIGWTSIGEWLEYSVDVSETGDYLAEFVVASKNGGGKIGLDVDGSVVLSGVSIPITNEWEIYDSITEQLYLSQGTHVIRLNIENNGFNLDRVNFSRETVTGSQSTDLSSLVIHPNPSHTGLFRLSQVITWQVYSSYGQLISSGKGNEIDINEQPVGIYIVKTINGMIKIAID